tara:strand:+ start:239 stop:415 length:177 start_codon:yes stop_codon:yes gene_type:complete
MRNRIVRAAQAMRETFEAWGQMRVQLENLEYVNMMRSFSSRSRTTRNSMNIMFWNFDK